jgi:hypothetical protein
MSSCRLSGAVAPSGEVRKEHMGLGRRGGTGIAWRFVRLGDKLREADLTLRLAYR